MNDTPTKDSEDQIEDVVRRISSFAQELVDEGVDMRIVTFALLRSGGRLAGYMTATNWEDAFQQAIGPEVHQNMWLGHEVHLQEKTENAASSMRH